MSTDRTAIVPAGALDGRVVQADRRMYRYTVPVDDRPHAFGLTGKPVHVANGATLNEVEFWAEHDDGAPEVAHRFQVFGTGHPAAGERPLCRHLPAHPRGNRVAPVRDCWRGEAAGMSPEMTQEAPPGDEAILKGLEPVAASMGMSAADLLAQLRAEAGEQQAGTSSGGGRFAEIAFFGHDKFTGYVTEVVKHGQPAYRVDLPGKLWGGNPHAYVEYAASAWFSERPRSEESVHRAWESEVRAAAERKRREDEWDRLQRQRALEAGDGEDTEDPDDDEGYDEDDPY